MCTRLLLSEWQFMISVHILQFFNEENHTDWSTGKCVTGKKFRLKSYLEKGENWIAHLVTSLSLTSFFSFSLMAPVFILPVCILDAYLTLSNPSSVNDPVLKQS